MFYKGIVTTICSLGYEKTKIEQRLRLYKQKKKTNSRQEMIEIGTSKFKLIQSS